MVELWGLLLVACAAVVAGYLWVMHAVENAVASETAEYDGRLDRIEERLDELEAVVEERED